MIDVLPKLFPSDFPEIKRNPLTGLQVNLGYRCNQSCQHCHVNAGPNRTEMMDAGTIQAVLDFLQTSDVKVLDLTGGAPELHPDFRSIVSAARGLGVHVIDRCNLTILEEPGQQDLAEFLVSQQVEIFASLPCYLEENVDRQRGNGAFESSIRALQKLNRLGYCLDEGLVLNLVYNPQGPSLPPSQSILEADYRQHLTDAYGVSFTRLITITNMPIKRFGSVLLSRGQFDDYMGLLKESHCSANLERLMCRTLLSVDWQGYLYDCDFNQMLELPIRTDSGQPLHIRDAAGLTYDQRDILVAEHCYGCTAGAGSSCGGALQ